jgi:hypothetical protein
MLEISGRGIKTPASLQPGGQPHVGATIVTQRLKSIELDPGRRPGLDVMAILDPQPFSRGMWAIAGYSAGEAPSSLSSGSFDGAQYWIC